MISRKTIEAKAKTRIKIWKISIKKPLISVKAFERVPANLLLKKLTSKEYQ